MPSSGLSQVDVALAGPVSSLNTPAARRRGNTSAEARSPSHLQIVDTINPLMATVYCLLPLPLESCILYRLMFTWQAPSQ